jgi:hypothetical protein
LQISPEDIRWEGEDPGILYRGGHSGQGRGAKKFFGHGGDTLGAGRGRGHPRFHSRKELVVPQNGIGNNVSDEIELLNTDSLVKEVVMTCLRNFIENWRMIKKLDFNTTYVITGGKGFCYKSSRFCGA